MMIILDSKNILLSNVLIKLLDNIIFLLNAIFDLEMLGIMQHIFSFLVLKRLISLESSVVLPAFVGPIIRDIFP